VEIPHDILIVQGGEQAGATEAFSAAFLDVLVSDHVLMELDDVGEEKVEEIAQELEDSGREAGLTESSTRLIKEELIEREETSRERREGGEGMVTNNSMEVIERIVIEDSIEKENYMIRTVGQVVRFQEDGPVPPRDVVTPVMESTPVAGHEKEGERVSFRPLTALKKKIWIPAEPIEHKSEEGENEGSGGELSSSRRSPLSAVSGGRRRVTKEDEVQFQLRPPRG